MFYDSFKHTTDSGICVKEAATVMEDDSVKPSMYEDFTEGAMVAVAESETNYTRLMMGIGITEAVAYSETGEAMVYTEGFISDVVDKIKTFFKKLWDKIKALFKRFVLMFDQYFKNDKDFLKKYKSRMLKSSNKDMTYNGYPFSKAEGLTNGSYATTRFNNAENLLNDINSRITSAGFNDVNNSTRGRQDDTTISEQREEIVDRVRGALLGKSGNAGVDSSDFHEEVFEYFHGSTSKETLDDSDPELNISNCITTIERSKEAINTAQKALDSIGKFIDKAIKSVENEMKTHNAAFTDDAAGTTNRLTKAEKESNNTRFVNTKIAIIRDASGAMTQLYGGYLTALKDMNRQARAICAKAIVKSGKINEESAGSEYFGGGSFLSSVVFK